MLDLLDLFRIRVGARPLLLMIGGLALLLAVRRRGGQHDHTAIWMRRAVQLTFGIGLAGLLSYPIIAIWYARDAHFFDNAEPTIPAVAWLFHLGQPLYHAVDAAARYSHIYGPMAFISHGAALAWLGPHVVVSKGLGATAGILSLVCLFFAIRRHHAAPAAAALTGVCALLLLCFRDYSFWTRPDPLQLLMVGGALLCAVSRRGATAAVLVGLASGVLWNLKFTGPLFSLPILVLLHQRAGRRGVVVAVAIAVVTAIAPFVFFANISFTHYKTWADLSASTGLYLNLLRQNIEWAVYFCVPLLLSYLVRARDRRPHDAHWRALITALGVGITGVVLAAAKPGAGPYHLMPFLPIIIYVVAQHTAGLSTTETGDTRLPRAAIAFVAVGAAIALAQQAQFVRTMVSRAQLREVADITRFADTHQGSVAMGYGETEALSFARPLLVFRSGAYLLDQPAVREHELAGVEIPRATIEALTACAATYWLVPKGERPFGGVNTYAAVRQKPLYPAAFREAFLATHTHVTTTEYFDVWQCRPGAPR